MTQYNYEIVDPNNELTKTQGELIIAVGEGKAVAQIAKERHRSPETIKTQLKTLKKEIGATNAPSLIAIAVAEGLLKITTTSAFVAFFGVYSLANPTEVQARNLQLRNGRRELCIEGEQ